MKQFLHRPPVNPNWDEWLHTNLGGWTPLKANVDGLLPHTWIYPSAGAYQDSLLTTPAVADGDPVGGYDNQGTDTYNLIQATSGAKPTLKLNILNNKPIIRADGGDFLQGTFAGGSLSHPITAFVVAKMDASIVNDNLDHIIIDGSGASNRFQLFQNRLVSPNAWSFFAGVQINSATATDANWHIFTVLANGASSKLWLDGILIASGNAGTNTISGFTIFRYSGAALVFWVGDNAEILVYSANLSNAAKNQVGQYFGSKYALPYTVIT